MKVYLAGPDVFRKDAIEHGKKLIEILKSYGFEGLWPLDNELTGKGPEISRNIYLANQKMIEDCDAVIANLMPFRGPSADVGTVWECAYAKALGKVVYGYGVDLSKYKDRVIGKLPHDGMIIEDWGLFDNLMLAHGIDGFCHSFTDACYEIKVLLETSR